MHQMKEETEEFLMLWEDFNTRIGSEDGSIGKDRKKKVKIRRSKDKVINKEGQVMSNKIKEKWWMILKRSYEKKGESVYIKKSGLLVINYGVTNKRAIEKVKKVEQRNRT